MGGEQKPTSPLWMRRFANVKITLCKIIKKLPYQKQGIFLQFRGGNPTIVKKKEEEFSSSFFIVF